MGSIPLLKQLLRKVDILLCIVAGAALTLLGISALYFFLVHPLSRHISPNLTEVVLAFGILFIGITLLVSVRVRTESMRWISFANLTFWFFSYGVAFNAQQYILGSYVDWDGPVQSIVLFGLTVLFAWLAYRYRRRSNHVPKHIGGKTGA